MGPQLYLFTHHHFDQSGQIAGPEERPADGPERELGNNAAHEKIGNKAARLEVRQSTRHAAPRRGIPSITAAPPEVTG